MNYNLYIFVISRENTIKKHAYHPRGHQTSSQHPYLLLDIGKVKNYLRFLLYKMDPLSLYSSMGPATIPSCNFDSVSSLHRGIMHLCWPMLCIEVIIKNIFSCGLWDIGQLQGLDALSKQGNKYTRRLDLGSMIQKQRVCHGTHWKCLS